MQLKLDQLPSHLKHKLASLYVIHGDEALLSIEAADQIRAAARKAGYSERELLQNERSFRWEELAYSRQNMSLFGDRKLIELRIPTGKPGKDGSAALQEHAKALDDQTVTLITMPRLDREQKNSAWFGALEAAGVVIEAPLIERARLNAWIGARLAAQAQDAAPEALEFIAERVEGNLLAAHQEIQKLGLLYPSGTLSAEQVEDAVLNVARYDVLKLREAMLAGDALRMVRMFEGLRAEGESAVLVHWGVTDEIRSLARVRAASQGGRPVSSLLRELRIWGPRERLYEPALRRIRSTTLKRALQRAAELDKMVKGLRGKNGSGDIWTDLTQLGLMIAT